jgi:phospholipid-translocating ATPase
MGNRREKKYLEESNIFSLEANEFQSEEESDSLLPISSPDSPRISHRTNNFNNFKLSEITEPQKANERTASPQKINQNSPNLAVTTSSSRKKQATSFISNSTINTHSSPSQPLLRSKKKLDDPFTIEMQTNFEDKVKYANLSGQGPPKQSLWDKLTGKPVPSSARTFNIGHNEESKSQFPPNIIRNQKYHYSTFIFVILYNQFKYFFNLYFLIICISQFVPSLRVTYIFTNVVPLALVLAITIAKEAFDDYKRYLRDKDANSQLYKKVLPSGDVVDIPSSDIAVGDLIHLDKDQRVPADMVFLRTSDKSGSTFIRTDQLDGETDWKLRVPISVTQKLNHACDIFNLNATVYAEKPHKDIHTFIGNFSHSSNVNNCDDPVSTESLNVENTLWMNTVLASGHALGVVIYTGKDTRAVMNTSAPKTKIGLIDQELNTLSKILCIVVVALSVSLVALKGFHGAWIVYTIRFIVLFSTIIPLSLRVNLDLGKTWYAHDITKDQEIPGVIVRTSTISEELGRIQYLLSDKTGTLTRNEMELKRVHLGTMAYGLESTVEIQKQLEDVALKRTERIKNGESAFSSPPLGPQRGRRDLSQRLFEIVQALAVCHNVTPIIEDDAPEQLSYQASSPDEVAIVKWTELVGMTLISRDRESIKIAVGADFRKPVLILEYEILHNFPFTSETKRMGIVLRDKVTGEVYFFEKGADMVMSKIVQSNDWLDEECGNMARDGLRTLVIGRKLLSRDQLDTFERRHHEAKISTLDRANLIQKSISDCLESDLELLGVTGVEDKLQDDVKMSLEILRNAGIKIWMLTGDKVETATCIATSSKLFSRNQQILQVQKTTDPIELSRVLQRLQASPELALVIDGVSLQAMMSQFSEEFMGSSCQLSGVVCCRCTPTQKADVVRAIKKYTGKRVASIGDGGNDVSMIQAADVGLGLEGKEGRQASLAADFSLVQFSHVVRLFLWHGRNSYKRTAKLSQFVIHRGFIIAVMQAVFSSLFYFAPISLYQGLLIIGYATIFTMAPVFSLVFDHDIEPSIALMYPELYKDLTKGRELSLKTFFKWLLVSVYQGGVIMLSSFVLFEHDFIHIVAITFTALLVNELLMVALEINTWHYIMVLCEIGSIFIYIISVRFLETEFDRPFMTSISFFSKVLAITLISFLPLYLIKVVRHFLSPPSYAKLS